MKNTIKFLALFFLVSNISLATVRTVSNLGGSQYGDYYSAYLASSDGDTLLIEGTDILYNWNNGLEWGKSLVVIGIGYNAQKMNTRHTKLETYTYNCCQPRGFVLTNGASGSKFYGIDFVGGISISNVSLNNLVFEDCSIGDFGFGDYGSNNVIFRNCIFPGENRNISFSSSTSVYNNILISSCIFQGYLFCKGNTVSSLTIDHSLFLYVYNDNTLFQGVYNSLIKNSIFMNSNNFTDNNTNTLLNNIARVTSMAAPNIGNTNPNFVNYSLGQYYSTAWDFHLQVGSAAIGAATDGTDIGLHGGSSNYNEKGEVLITPIVRLLNINNTTVAPGGTINVHINATKPGDN